MGVCCRSQAKTSRTPTDAVALGFPDSPYSGLRRCGAARDRWLLGQQPQGLGEQSVCGAPALCRPLCSHDPVALSDTAPAPSPTLSVALPPAPRLETGAASVGISTFDRSPDVSRIR